MKAPQDPLIAALAREGHQFVRAADMRPRLERCGALHDWAAFAASWDALPIDGYMADGGRYRRRRHATFAAQPGSAIQRQPHQPHYQSRDYNPLNGGIQRWFEPVDETIAAGATLQSVLRFCRQTFDALVPEPPRWHVEVHQFRVEALAGGGNPTPEGMHRDGVDYVLVLLVRRHNVASGTTTIRSPQNLDLGSFTLTDPMDASLLDDARVFHGVTPVVPVDAAMPAFRDVLVVTFRRASEPAE
ncbi:MAG TPA: 2OG-Fe dioxygenase family protein [Solimonas sp.]|nr:2OG-Fe dioxygenase family protein [Solimonas sp.]